MGTLPSELRPFPLLYWCTSSHDMEHCLLQASIVKLSSFVSDRPATRLDETHPLHTAMHKLLFHPPFDLLDLIGFTPV